MRLAPKIKRPFPGRCIYCPHTHIDCKMSEEHVVPLSFGGNLVIVDGSCRCCATETGAIEGSCSGRMFKALRVHHKVPTRRPKNRPTHLQVINGKTPHGAPVVLTAVDDAPGVVIFPYFATPGILINAPLSSKISVTGHIVYSTTPDAKDRQRRLVETGFAGALAHTEY
jgi:hypothetical protein